MCLSYPYFVTPILWFNKLLWQEMDICNVNSILYIPAKSRITAPRTQACKSVKKTSKEILWTLTIPLAQEHVSY